MKPVVHRQDWSFCDTEISGHDGFDGWPIEPNVRVSNEYALLWIRKTECPEMHCSRLLAWSSIAAAVGLSVGGCSGVGQWWHNGLKVGPELLRRQPPYQTIGSMKSNPKIRSEWPITPIGGPHSTIPVLDRLVHSAYTRICLFK
jgi:hypothetical protein